MQLHTRSSMPPTTLLDCPIEVFRAAFQSVSHTSGPSSFSSQPIATLLNLPSEILNSIFKSLSRHDFCTMCLVSKALCAITEQWLYTRIDLTCERRIILLLRTMISRPQLTAYNQILDLDGSLKVSLESYELRPLVIAVGKSKLPNRELFMLEMAAGTMDPFVALLLSQLHNLRSLRLGPSFSYKMNYIGLLFKSALCATKDSGLPLFEYLQDVEITAWRSFTPQMTESNTRNILPIFYLPGVQHISASIQNSAGFEWPCRQEPSLTNLTSLSLRFIRETYLFDTLSATPALKKLQWEWFYRDDVNIWHVTPVIDLDAIVEAFSPVRETLTELIVTASTEENIMGIYPKIEITGSMSRLVDFKLLTQFEAPMPFLTGFSSLTITPLMHVMPRNIKHLTVSNCLYDQVEIDWSGVNLVRSVEVWLANWKTYTPDLQSISLSYRHEEQEGDYRSDEQSWRPVMEGELQKMCAQAGIEFEIQHTSQD